MSSAQPYCDRLRRWFDDFHDDLVSSFVKKVIERHLTQCSRCSKEYDLFLHAMEACRTMTVPDVPPHVLKRVIKDLTEPGGGASMPTTAPETGPATGLNPA